MAVHNFLHTPGNTHRSRPNQPVFEEHDFCFPCLLIGRVPHELTARKSLDYQVFTSPPSSHRLSHCSNQMAPRVVLVLLLASPPYWQQVLLRELAACLVLAACPASHALAIASVAVAVVALAIVNCSVSVLAEASFLVPVLLSYIPAPAYWSISHSCRHGCV